MDLIAKARAEVWGDTSLLTILQALPMERWTWDQVTQQGEPIELADWRWAPVIWAEEKADEVDFAIGMLMKVGRARHTLSLAERGKTSLPSHRLIEVLEEAALQPFDNTEERNETNMFQYHVSEIFEALDDRKDVTHDTLAALEWKYLRVLEDSSRPPKHLLMALSEKPSFFIEVLSVVFKPNESSGVVDPEPADLEQRRAIAQQAFLLLDLWNHIPGTRADGAIDGEALEAWITQARRLAKAASREEIADSRIGTMLSASPMGSDGAWPAEPVRAMIDFFRSKSMTNGFEAGKMNRRGITSRSYGEGGDLERREAAMYREWASTIAFEHPQTAAALDRIADDYEREARLHDEDAERIDWRS